MSPYLSKHAPAAALDTAMGSPSASGLFSYACRIEEDEYEYYPSEALQWLDRWGMQQYYVPVSLGGMLDNFEVLFSLIRTISRRDLTVAVSHAVSFLSSVAIWIAGSQEQKAELAKRLLGGERISLALTERRHGGDLLSLETEAYSQYGIHHLLSGEKWLINGANRNSLISVLARTSRNGGPRGFSLFLFDKHTAHRESFQCLDKIHTLGVRGADVSGVAFHKAPVDASSMIGAPGEGFEIVLKGLQLSRLLCGALSLGAAETAFRAALDFALARQVYRGTVFEIPQCRRLLVESWADLLLCDFLLTAAARSLHFVPSEASVHSAVIKYLIPHILEHTLKQLSVVLGARYYLRREYSSGIFQKMLRDSSLVSLFDGSSIVNLYSLTTQFKALGSCEKKALSRPKNICRLPVCKLSVPLPEFKWDNLSVASSGKNLFVTSLSSSLDALRELNSTHGFPTDVALILEEQLNTLESAIARLMTEISVINWGSPHVISSSAFDRAHEYCAVEAAAITLQMWLANHNRTHRHLSDGRWLVLALARLNAYLGQRISFSDDFIEKLVYQALENRTNLPDASLANRVLKAA